MGAGSIFDQKSYGENGSRPDMFLKFQKKIDVLRIDNLLYNNPNAIVIAVGREVDESNQGQSD